MFLKTQPIPPSSQSLFWVGIISTPSTYHWFPIVPFLLLLLLWWSSSLPLCLVPLSSLIILALSPKAPMSHVVPFWMRILQLILAYVPMDVSLFMILNQPSLTLRDFSLLRDSRCLVSFHLLSFVAFFLMYGVFFEHLQSQLHLKVGHYLVSLVFLGP